MEHWRRYRHPQVYRTEARPKKQPLRLLTWRPTRQWLMVIAVLLVAIGLVWLVTASALFRIADVVVLGEATPAIDDALHDLIGRNLLFLKEHELLTDLMATDPSLASLHIVRGFPDHLQVVIARRHPVLVWQVGETAWAIDPSGVAFGLDPTTSVGIPRIIDSRGQPVSAGEQLLSVDFVAFVEKAFAQGPLVIGGAIDHGEVGETTFHLSLVTEWGWTIVVDTTRPIDGQYANLGLLLAQHRADIHTYVDLRLAGKAYVK